MGRYTLRRLLQLIPVFLGTTFLIYVLVWSIPGDPLAGQCGERGCPQPFIDRLEAKFHLDEPIWLQYLYYLGNLLQGDFGETVSGLSVNELIAETYPVTVQLALVAITIEAVIGITAGVVTGLRGGGFLDNLVLVSTLVLIAIPIFVTGFVLQFLLGIKLAVVSPTVPNDFAITDLLLPGFILASASMAVVSRLARVALVENKRADYVRTAVAKGMSPSRVTGVHLLRNSLIPVVTFIGIDIGNLMGGAIVTEGIFNIRGIGGLLFNAIGRKESSLVVSVVVILVIVYLLSSLIVDLLYGALDPRIRYE